MEPKRDHLVRLFSRLGLEVEVLDGRPGLYSARYARASVNSDAGRRTELLKELVHPAIHSKKRMRDSRGTPRGSTASPAAMR